jgi:hypothetical protein
MEFDDFVSPRLLRTAPLEGYSCPRKAGTNVTAILNSWQQCHRGSSEIASALVPNAQQVEFDDRGAGHLPSMLHRLLV